MVSSLLLIVSDDIDMFLLSLAFQGDIPISICIKTGTRVRVQYVNTSLVAASLGAEVCKAIVGLHAYTSCDTTSAFAGRGKVNALKLVIANAEYTRMLQDLGSTWSLSQDLFQKLQAFTRAMCVPKNQNNF